MGSLLRDFASLTARWVDIQEHAAELWICTQSQFLLFRASTWDVGPNNPSAQHVVYTLIELTQSLLQRLLAIICLIGLGLQCAIGTTLVRCTDAQGHSKIELVCIQNDDGQCAEDLGTSHEEHGPCKNSPLNERVLAAAVKLKSAPIAIAAPELTGILPPISSELRVSAMLQYTGFTETFQQRPPTVRLRSVILLV